MLRLSIRKQFDTHGKDYLISSSQNTKLNKISLNNVSYTTTDITLSKKNDRTVELFRTTW